MTLSAVDILGPDGFVSQKLPNYEARHEQIEMAQAVEAAFGDSEHLLAEAGTGVGKSFAYLVPAILATAEGRRVVVSTYTISLQEQLIGKDIPFLRDVMDVPFSAVLGKGRRNYLCFRRLSQAIKNRKKLFMRKSQTDELETIARWSMETQSGSLQDIDFRVASEVWEKVRAEPGLCRGHQCPNYANCHFQHARKEIQSANIVVVNHALFFSDLAIQTASARLLGKYDMVVLDEAHTVEQVASDHFGSSVSSSATRHLIRELYNDQTDRGLLSIIGDEKSIRAANRAQSAADSFFEELRTYRGSGIAENGRIREAGIITNVLTPALSTLASALRRIRTGSENSEQSYELLGFEQRALEMAELTEKLVQQSEESQVYWVQVRGGKGKGSRGKARSVVTMASAPIDVSPIIRKLVFDEVKSAVLTSATLATARGDSHGFDYARKRLGMDGGREILLASPFDFRSQAKLYVETELGDPNRLEAFAGEASRAIEYYVEKSEGRCFVLFTSYAMLSAVAEELEDFCEVAGYELLAQGQDLPRGMMLKKFRAQPRSILLGTMSFWQGVDVAGEALSNVIITKLPFMVPNEPIVEARIDIIRQAGGNPFGDYQLPEAVIRFKQGFGRLIRTQSDTGFVVVLDNRIVTKSYGRQFLRALPDVEVVRDEFCHRHKALPDGDDGCDDGATGDGGAGAGGANVANVPDDLWEYM